MNLHDLGLTIPSLFFLFNARRRLLSPSLVTPEQLLEMLP
jgi:hypothetical protein